MEHGSKTKQVLFSNPVLKVLDFLLSNSEQELIDAEIAARIKSVKKSAINVALRRLSESGITSRTRRGRMVFNRLKETPLVLHLKIVSNLVLLQPLVDTMAPKSSKIILFGSRGDGTNNSKSDFDLFVISKEDSTLKKSVRLSPLAEIVQLIIKTPEQMLTFEQEEPVLYEQIKKGIPLWQKE